MRRKRKIVFLAIAILCGLAFSPMPAEGALITIEIEAVVDSVWDEGNYLEGNIEAGDIIKGFYTYDSSTPDQDWLWGSESDVVGRYHYFEPPYGISLTVGEFVFGTNPDSVSFVVSIINNNQSGDDVYTIGSSNNLPLSNGTLVDSVSWTLKDHTGSVFSSDALPTTAPVLDQWGDNRLRLHGERGGYIVDAHVISAIPEPATIVLLSIGGLFLRKRR